MTALAALAGAITISFAPILFALAEVSPVTGAFFRVAYALPGLGILWWLRRKEDGRAARSRWLAFAAGLALGGDMIAWHASITQIGAGLATLLVNSQVIFVAIAAWALHGERPNRQVAYAIPVVLAGVALVSGLGQGEAFGENPLLGTGLALLAAVFYATFLLAFRRSNETQAPGAGPLLEATLGAFVASLTFGLLGPGIDFQITWPAHGWLLTVALGAQIAGWLLIGYALPRLPAVETATIILFQPALAMVWGALIFGERPSLLQIAGAVIVMAGVAAVVVGRSREPAMAAAQSP